MSSKVSVALENQQIHFKSLTDSIDMKTPVGRFAARPQEGGGVLQLRSLRRYAATTTAPPTMSIVLGSGTVVGPSCPAPTQSARMY